MYKSHLECPTCGFERVKFDPFLYLTLQLPGWDSRHIKLRLIDFCGDYGILQIAVTVSRQGIVQDIFNKVAELLDGVNAEDHAKVRVYILYYTTSSS